MFISAVAISDFGTSVLIFVVSLAGALAHVVIVSWHLFNVFPYLRHVLQLIDLSYYSKTSVSAFSLGISMNLGGYFSLKVSRSCVKTVFLVFIHVAVFTSRRLYSFFSSLP